MIDHQVIIKGNEVRWVQWNDQALFDDHGNLQEYQSVGRDITDLKRLEESLSSSKNSLPAYHRLNDRWGSCDRQELCDQGL